MATLITKRSTTSGVVPVSGDLQVGELAVNTADAKLWTKHSDNSIKEIGAGASGGNPWVIYEFDIGSKPRRSFTFTITDVSVSPTSVISVEACGKPATGRGVDDYEWDMGMFAAKAGTGEFRVTVYFTGRCVGKRNLQYKVQ